MLKGISTNRNLKQIAGQLKNAQIDFVFRYYCAGTTPNPKRLTADEAEALGAAGLQIGVVYEISDKPEYFTNAHGHRDGVSAWNEAAAVNQPAGSAIYFAVDYDASQAAAAGSILDYFQGVERGLEDAANGTHGYMIGVYGSGLVCAFLKSHCPWIRYTWLAEARDWTGSQTYQDWDVRQSIATVDLCGLKGTGPADDHEYESNEAKGDFGGFVPAHHA